MQATDNLYIDVPIEEWVKAASADPVKHRDRRVTHILLTAIGLTPVLRENMLLKGGTLMTLAFDSPRGTRDVDFTVLSSPEPFASNLSAKLNPAMQAAATQLGYLDLVCQVQSMKRQPKAEMFETARGAALITTIGHATRGTNEEKRLRAGQAPHALQVDISFNEPVVSQASVTINHPSVTILAYSPFDIIGEKLRALLQQEDRNRFRRQDVFDIAWLIDAHHPDHESQKTVLLSAVRKSGARDVSVTRDGLDDPELKRRASRDWNTLDVEVQNLPDFDATFEKVVTFYKGLPWGEVEPD